ncbi:hypothetical protein QAD02_010285 [Eretmocerus hayati]|uniref:Uncharacterized protein n=1 Tax=Eretmocerus hayati TaxID=131215 RepID=A0ACC2NEC8_9HYME|nr:hypothetical protein QAD02_010285 [Eretmocerus hayati]
MIALRYFVFIALVIGQNIQPGHSLCGSKCEIDINKKYGMDKPLFLDEETLEVVYPVGSSKINFCSDEEYLLHCFGGHLKRSDTTTDVTSEPSKCLKGLKFIEPSSKAKYTFDEVKCTGNPKPGMREVGKCNDGVLVNISYQVTKDRFWDILDLCYVDDLSTTTWAHSVIPKIIGEKKNEKYATPGFVKGQFFQNVAITNVYTNQLKAFEEIFHNDMSKINRYLPPKTGRKGNIYPDGNLFNYKNYLERGHLVPRADKFYLQEQKSTYFYVNVLPMWFSINRGNWRFAVEGEVRKLATKIGDLDVWTGGLGILDLEGREIFLSKHKRKSASKQVPVPKLLYKLVYSKAKNSCVAFVVANNPYLDENRALPKDYQICKQTELCNNIKKSHQFEMVERGYTYCCECGDFLGNELVKKIGIPLKFSEIPKKLVF